MKGIDLVINSGYIKLLRILCCKLIEKGPSGAWMLSPSFSWHFCLNVKLFLKNAPKIFDRTQYVGISEHRNFLHASEQMFKPFALARRVKDLVLDMCRLNFLIRILLGEFTWGSGTEKRLYLCFKWKGLQSLNVHMLGKMGWTLISHNTSDFQLICCHIASVLASTGRSGLFAIRSHTFHCVVLDIHQDSRVNTCQ